MSISYSELAPVLRSVLSVLRAFAQISEGTGSGSSLPVLQFEALHFLSINLDATTKDVARELGLSMPAMSQLAKRLIKSKLVERAYTQKDKRITKLRITPIGSLEYKRLLIYLNDNLKKIFNNITDTELETYIALNKRLLENIRSLVNTSN